MAIAAEATSDTAAPFDARQRLLNTVDAIEAQYKDVHPLSEVICTMLRGWAQTAEPEFIESELGKLYTLIGLVLHGE